MPKRMLIDASHPEETRVVVTDGARLDEFDVETSTKKQLKGNIYLAKVVRVEPSLQAAFVEYGGNRHGFLAFGEIHPDYYQIPVADRQRLIAAQVEEARAAEAEEEAADAQAAQSEPATPAPHAEEEAAEEEPPVEHAGPAEPTDQAEPAATDLPPIGNASTAETGQAPANLAPTAPIEPQPDQPDAPLPQPEPAPRAQPLAMAMAVEQINGPTETLVGDDAGPAPPAPDIIEVAAEPAPPPESINADAAETAEDDQAPRRIPPKFLRNYKIQEVIKRRQILLVQVVKEERGNKGAALTTYLSLAGRYCVLMPNSPRGGGISRKITSAADRRRLREITTEMAIPDGMGLIVRTAGAQRPKTEIKRDCEYLLRLWDSIRETTLASSAPALIYEEASLIKRSIRDVYTRDVEEVVVEGEDAYRQAKDFMRMLMPSHARKVQPYRDPSTPLFVRERIEAQLDAMHSPTVQLKSGGYVVINQTEALVAIDVNSGRSTRERGIEETALRTNLEAADEIARQLRLRDLAGLIVIDFIDMESARHNASVERRLKEALKHDRARIQVGRISHFGLLEMSRQRLRPSLTEQAFVTCPHCTGTGLVRTTESAAMQVLRAIEEEGAKRRSAEIAVTCATALALYLLNHKRERLAGIEAQAGMRVVFTADDSLNPPAHRIERTRAAVPVDGLPASAPVPASASVAAEPDDEQDDVAEEADVALDERQDREEEAAGDEDGNGDEEGRRRRRRRRRRGRREESGPAARGAGASAEGMPAAEPPPDGQHDTAAGPEGEGGDESEDDEASPSGVAPSEARDATETAEQRRRRRGRRGGRRRRREEGAPGEPPAGLDTPAEASPVAVEPEAAGEEPASRSRWAGPTPADPFATSGEYDVYAAMEAAEEAAAREADARLHARQAPEPEPVPAPVATETALSPAPEAAPAAAPDNGLGSAQPALTAEPRQAAEPRPEPQPAAPAVQPILVDEAPPDAPRRRGWWKR
jgi:ribonuclease E